VSANPSPARISNLPAVCSLACLAAQVVWVGICIAFVVASDPGKWLAGFAGLAAAIVGVCFLSAAGMAFGFAGSRSGWGLVTLILNAALFFLTAFALLKFFEPL
jgi:hypothetical protein